VKARRGDAAFFGGRAGPAASDVRASALDVRSSETGLPDGMGMNISGGYQKLQQDAPNLQIPVQDKVDSDR